MALTDDNELQRIYINLSFANSRNYALNVSTSTIFTLRQSPNEPWGHGEYRWLDENQFDININDEFLC